MSRAADDFDALAGAFLTGGAGAKQRRDIGQGPTLLVVGNVPTLAGIWIAQYADQMARAQGPVALVRLDGAASRGELFRGQGRALPNDATKWLERAGAITRNWILCVDSQARASGIIESGCQIVFLSGTDEAALAALRKKVEAIDISAREHGVKSLPIGLAFVGSTNDVSSEAAARLVAWAKERSMIAKPVLAMQAQRVDRVESTGPVPLPMFSGLDEASAAELVALAIEGSPVRLDAAPPVTIVPEAAVAVPSKSAALEARAPVSAAQVDLFPEFSRIPFECPDAPRIQLGCDSAGALHLIASGSDANALRVARSWAKGNWKLLCAAHAALNASAPQVIEHLLLDDAREAVTLHRSGVLLHAIVAAGGAHSSARVRVDLNDASTAGID